MTSRTVGGLARHKARLVLATAKTAGLWDGGDIAASLRIPRKLLASAKAQSGISSVEHLVNYALAHDR